MNIAVIGLGSMGKRRVRLLLEFIRQEKAAEAAEWQIYGVDAREDRRTICGSLASCLPPGGGHGVMH